MKDTNNISCTIGGILKVTVPLVLTALSANLMFVSDRMILAYYSIDAMNAVGISSVMVAIMSYMFISIACTAEIYVGQYNGSQQIDNLAKPAWQMIYLSLLANIIFIPMGIFSQHLNMLPEYYKVDGIAYQSLLSYFCCFPCLTAAVSSFFIGQGKTAIITMIVFGGNVLNIILSIILIFGIEGIIPSLGCIGAAVGTITSEVTQFIVLFALFLRKSARRQFNTLKCRRFDKEIFRGCLKIGAPMSIGRLFELGAWYLIYVVLSHVSKEMATVQGILTNIFVLFAFFQEGLGKGISTLSANFIGMKNLEGIRRLLKIFVILTIVVGGIISIPLIIFPKLIFKLLINIAGDEILSLYPIIKTGFPLMVLSIVFETLGVILWGILMSGGDTKYPLVANLSCLWAVVVIPTIVMYYNNTLNNIIVWKLCIIWAVLSLFFIYKRYKSLKWYKKLV
jgi:MATE family multidrug resistance protein